MLRIFISLLFCLSAATSFAADSKKIALDTKNSTVNWKGWKLAKLADNHYGTVSLSKDSHLMVNNGKILSGTLIIDMTSIKSTDIKNKKKNAQLVGHLSGADFFDVENNKVATYKITSANVLRSGKQEFKGTLTIRGNKQENVSVLTTVTDKNKVLLAKGKLVFDRSKFDVKYKSKSFFPNLVKTAKEKVISDDIELTFTIKTKAL